MFQSNILTDGEVASVSMQLKRNKGMSEKEVEDVLAQLAFYVECGMISSAILSGDLEVTGYGENGLEYRLSEKARKRLH